MSVNRLRLLLLCAALLLAPMGVAQAGPLLQQDFQGVQAWPGLAALTASAGVTVKATRDAVGTVDTAGSVTPSGAARLTIGGSRHPWTAGLTSGLLPVRTPETNLGKLTLSFDASLSSARPVTVVIESFSAKRKRTGGLAGVVYPAAANFFQRSALDLSAMTPSGAGKFAPADPFVQITWKVSGRPAGVSDVSQVALSVDNVEYASPAFYVSPQGSDSNDGRTERTAFANPQKAVDAARPGDIILLMDGTYGRPPNSTVQNSVIDFQRGGTPAAWISVKNYPGQHPILTTDSWCTIKVGRGGDGVPVTASVLCYLEVRGLHIRGNADTINKAHPELLNLANSLTNGNGISGSGGQEAVLPHHLRFADNLVEYCSGGGIGTGDCDWVTIENNTIRNNCWWTIYATSGAGLLGVKNFDATKNVYKCLIRNNIVSNNICFDKWRVKPPRFSDGNGIIIDTTYLPKNGKRYEGRTLIEGNLSFNNGGSGIHAFRANHVDIINNTAYYNGASPELRWGQIFIQESDDMHLMNNILVSRPGQPISSVGPGGGDQNSTNVMRAGNLYFGGLTPNNSGPTDMIADPQFMNASTDYTVADFHIRPGSPALKSGWRGDLLPLRDLDGKPYPLTGAPDRGAYQSHS